jgi:hypothetical protein
VFAHKNVLLLHHSIIFGKLGACAETISTWFVILFTISRFLVFKSATDTISIENSLSAEIRQVTNFRGLKLDWWPISVMEIGSLNGPLETLLRNLFLGYDKRASAGFNPTTFRLKLY